MIRAINDLIDYCASLRPVQSKDTFYEHGPNGVVRRARVSGPQPGVNDFPFEIYQSDTWLKYKVKTGYVITTGEPIEPTNIETEITLAAGVEFYWIYASLTTTTATILSSATLPAWSVSIVPIGWVDTLTGEADTVAEIHQFLHDNIFVPCTL